LALSAFKMFLTGLVTKEQAPFLSELAGSFLDSCLPNLDECS
jgi:hypothetical protein